MHFVISWDIKTTGSRRDLINDSLKASLKAYSWVRPLTTFYIVQISNQLEWDKILKGLTDICQLYAKEVDLIVTPPMQGGKYNGFLSAKMWEEVNKRSA